MAYFQIYYLFDSTFRLIDMIARWYDGFAYLQISYSIDLTFHIVDDSAYLCEAPGMQLLRPLFEISYGIDLMFRLLIMIEDTMALSG